MLEPESLGKPDYFALQRESNPLVMWGMQEGTGPVAYDLSGNGRDGTIYSPVNTWAYKRPLGNLKCSAWHAQSTTYFTKRDAESWMNDSANLNAITIEVIARTSGSFSNYPNFCGMDNATSERKFYFRWNSNKELCWCVTTTGGLTELKAGLADDAASSPNVISSSRPLHLVGTYDGSTMKIYAGGRLIGSGAKTGTIATTSTIPLYLGRTAYAGYYFYGDLAGFAWYPTALSQETIIKHAKAAGLVF